MHEARYFPLALEPVLFYLFFLFPLATRQLLPGRRAAGHRVASQGRKYK